MYASHGTQSNDAKLLVCLVVVINMTMFDSIFVAFDHTDTCYLRFETIGFNKL